MPRYHVFQNDQTGLLTIVHSNNSLYSQGYSIPECFTIIRNGQSSLAPQIQQGNNIFLASCDAPDDLKTKHPELYI